MRRRGRNARIRSPRSILGRNARIWSPRKEAAYTMRAYAEASAAAANDKVRESSVFWRMRKYNIMKHKRNNIAPMGKSVHSTAWMGAAGLSADGGPACFDRLRFHIPMGKLWGFSIKIELFSIMSFNF